MRAGVPLPRSMLLNPISCELMGAGFQKIPFSKVSEHLALGLLSDNFDTLPVPRASMAKNTENIPTGATVMGRR
jgi:hypothetical protein